MDGRRGKEERWSFTELPHVRFETVFKTRDRRMRGCVALIRLYGAQCTMHGVEPGRFKVGSIRRTGRTTVGLPGKRRGSKLRTPYTLFTASK